MNWAAASLKKMSVFEILWPQKACNHRAKLGGKLQILSLLSKYLRTYASEGDGHRCPRIIKSNKKQFFFFCSSTINLIHHQRHPYGRLLLSFWTNNKANMSSKHQKGPDLKRFMVSLNFRVLVLHLITSYETYILRVEII